MTEIYLSTSEVGKYLGISPATAQSYHSSGRLPEPDAKIGKTNGWKKETIDKWNATRPGRGHRSDLDRVAQGNTP